MAAVAILISSFDGFSDCWEPVCHGITKYWSDCPYSIFLITNTKDFTHEKVTTIKIGEDKGWANNLLMVLKQIDATYIMYFQEDYWIRERVNSSAITEYVRTMDKMELNYLRLLAYPTPDSDFMADQRLGVLAENAPYRTALQIALWRKEVLLDLLKPGESPWEFEVRGSTRSRKYGNSFLSVKQFNDDPYYNGISYVCTAINRGRWARIAKEYAKDEGLNVDWSNLPSETWWHEYVRSTTFGAWLQLTLYRIGLVFKQPKIAFDKALNRTFALLGMRNEATYKPENRP